jgi:chorismate synthase
MQNSFGNIFRITSFGESHGKALGVVIDNCPPNIELCEEDIQRELDRRKPGQSSVSTPRKEGDKCEILSGVFEGKTTGTSLAVVVFNINQKSKDYSNIKDIFRPSHADFGYFSKYGIRDYRGGGRSSARETIARVIGGAIAKKILAKFGIDIFGFVKAIGETKFENFDKEFIEKNSLRMADEAKFPEFLKKVEKLKEVGDSIGGVVEVRVENVMAGLGNPVFGKLEAQLAGAMMSIPATKYFEMGEGIEICQQKGSEANDKFIITKNSENSRDFEESELKNSNLVNSGKIVSERNVNGGILGGISTGNDLYFRVGIKPTSSISISQQSVNKKGEVVDLQVFGRHDPILVARAVPVLESMTALVLLDAIMMQKAQCELF